MKIIANQGASTNFGVGTDEKADVNSAGWR